MTFDIRIASNSQYYFVIKAENGQVLATSETYVNNLDCIHAAKLIIAEASEATITVNGLQLDSKLL